MELISDQNVVVFLLGVICGQQLNVKALKKELARKPAGQFLKVLLIRKIGLKRIQPLVEYSFSPVLLICQRLERHALRAFPFLHAHSPVGTQMFLTCTASWRNSCPAPWRGSSQSRLRL